VSKLFYKIFITCLAISILLCSSYAFDCPETSANFSDLDITSNTNDEAIATGFCACLYFGPALIATDSTITLTILLMENEPVRAFQFEVVDNTENALVLNSVLTGDKTEGWSIPSIETDQGNGLVLGFSLSGEETLPGHVGTLIEITFDIVGHLGQEISFYLGDSSGVLLANADAQNVACIYPDSENPITYPTKQITANIHEEALPREYALKQNFPNPFNPITTIEFHLKSIDFVEISLYNLLGQEISTLVRRNMLAGRHFVVWDGRNQRGESLASGIYIYIIRTENFIDQKKMVLLR